MSDDMIDLEVIQEFIEESRDLIAQLEPTIIELGQNQEGEELNAIFRLFHSIKGSAGFLGYTHISSVSHAAENLLDAVRSDEILFDPSHVGLLCQTCDFAKDALDCVENNLSDEELSEEGVTLSTVLKAALEEGKRLMAGDALPEIEAPAAEKTPHKKTVSQTKKRVKAKKSKSKTSVKKELYLDKGTPSEAEIRAELDAMITPDMVERFVLEADELLEEVENDLLQWLEVPSDEAICAELFRHFHSFKGNAGFLGFRDLEKMTHHIETMIDKIKAGVPIDVIGFANLLLQLKDLLRDTVAAISEGEKGEIEGLDLFIQLLDEQIPEGSEANAVLPSKSESRPLGKLLVEEGAVSEADLEAALAKQKQSLGEILVDMGVTNKEAIEATVEKQQKARKSKPVSTKKPAIVKRQDIRVDLLKLDNLINLIGELVISENMLVHNPDLEGLDLENFSKSALQMNKIVRELQEVAMTIRMIPVSGLFKRMIRLVHDLGIKTGKLVDLQISGDETEVDKTVIETISDPLVHLLRNSMDHGLEIPADRISAGKPDTGVVMLSAKHEEGEVWITIEDDGRGLDKDRILAKAIEKDLVEADAHLSEHEIFQLILLPGFSTADKITDVSGRGVGMDVVKQNLERVKGKIEVRSKKGQGTRMTLRIPLTLAIIEGMAVRVGERKCIIPILAVREFFLPTPEAITISPDGQEIVRVREEFLPVVRLHEWLKYEPDHHDLTQGVLVVLEVRKTNVCLFVDQILGQQQTVIKGLSEYIGSVRGIAGCTILGNGEVCLILDVAAMIEIAENELVGV